MGGAVLGDAGFFAALLGTDLAAALDDSWLAALLFAVEDGLVADGFPAGFGFDEDTAALGLVTGLVMGLAGLAATAGLVAFVGLEGALFVLAVVLTAGLAALEAATGLAFAAGLAGVLAGTAADFAFAAVTFPGEDLAAAPEDPDFDGPDLEVATFEFADLEPVFAAEGLPDLPDIAPNTPCAEVTFKFKLFNLLNQALL